MVENEKIYEESSLLLLLVVSLINCGLSVVYVTVFLCFEALFSRVFLISVLGLGFYGLKTIGWTTQKTKPFCFYSIVNVRCMSGFFISVRKTKRYDNLVQLPFKIKFRNYYGRFFRIRLPTH